MGRVSHCGNEVLLWMGLSLLCFSSYWPLLSKDAHTVSFLSLSYLVFELLKANACVVSCSMVVVLLYASVRCLFFPLLCWFDER